MEFIQETQGDIQNIETFTECINSKINQCENRMSNTKHMFLVNNYEKKDFLKIERNDKMSIQKVLYHVKKYNIRMVRDDENSRR